MTARKIRKTPTTKTKSPARPKPQSTSGESNIVLVGSPSACRFIERAAGKIDVVFRQVSWEADLTLAVNQQSVAVIFSEPPPKGKLSQHVKVLREKLPDKVAVVVVVPDETDDRSVREFYISGAAVVFAWPSESLLLGTVLAQALALRWVRGPARESDRALARVIKAHCKVLEPPISELDVSSRDGVVELRGEVGALWQKNLLERRVGEVPGVLGVRLDAVHVSPSSFSDRQVRASVQKLVQEVTEHTVAISVSRGRVSLAGSVHSGAEVRRLQDLVAHVRGVRDIENLVVVAAATDTDRRLAERVRKTLETRFSGVGIDVVAFGGNIVLSGTLPTLAMKLSIQDTVSHLRGVQRIVDKLSVRSS